MTILVHACETIATCCTALARGVAVLRYEMRCAREKRMARAFLLSHMTALFFSTSLPIADTITLATLLSPDMSTSTTLTRLASSA